MKIFFGVILRFVLLKEANCKNQDVNKQEKKLP